MKRKLKWLAIVLVVSLLGFGTALLLWPRDRITVESRQKIRTGMTEDEVAEILGSRGITYEEAEAQYQRLEKEVGKPPFDIEGARLQEPEDERFAVLHRARIWIGRRGSIEIEFDQDNRVWWKSFQGVRWNNGSILDRLRDWLDW
jgi:hypothetical protein